MSIQVYVPKLFHSGRVTGPKDGHGARVYRDEHGNHYRRPKMKAFKYYRSADLFPVNTYMFELVLNYNQEDYSPLDEPMVDNDVRLVINYDPTQVERVFGTFTVVQMLNQRHRSRKSFVWLKKVEPN